MTYSKLAGLEAGVKQNLSIIDSKFVIDDIGIYCISSWGITVNISTPKRAGIIEIFLESPDFSFAFDKDIPLYYNTTIQRTRSIWGGGYVYLRILCKDSSYMMGICCTESPLTIG